MCGVEWCGDVVSGYWFVVVDILIVSLGCNVYIINIILV